MKKLGGIRSNALSLSLLLGLSAVPVLQAADGAGNGHIIYTRYCALCHGPNGLADTEVGRILRPRPRRFADPIEMARLTDDQMYHAIKEGVLGTSMAAWNNVLSETEIGDVMDYIHSMSLPKGPRMTDEEVSLAVGRRVYEKECSFCHGRKGDADTDAARVLTPPPRKFSDPIEMARIDDGRLYAAIKIGVSGTAMASWGDRLSPIEIIDVMRYIRSLEQPLPEGIKPSDLDLIVGERIYQQYCVACHGKRGDADTPLGHALSPRPRDFTRQKEMAQLSDDRLKQSIIHGIAGTAMAPWGGILNPEDVRRVILHIRKDFQHQR